MNRILLALLTASLLPGALAATPPAAPSTNLNDLLAPLVKDPQTTLREQYTSGVRPLLDKTTADETALNDAVKRFTAWRDDVTREKLDDAFKAQTNEGWTMIARGVEASVNRSFDRCLGGEDVALAAMLYWVKWTEQNSRLAPYFKDKLDGMKKKAENCGTYELEFTSYIKRDDGMADRVRAVTTVQLYSAGPRARPFQVVPAQHLEHVEGSYQPCPYEVLRFDSDALAIVDVQLDTRVGTDLLADLTGPNVIDPVLMIVEPHLEVELLERCPTVDPSEYRWSQWDFDDLHADEAITFYELVPDVEVKGFAITDFTLDAHGDLRRAYRRTVTTEGGATFEEDTAFVLRHRPVR